MVLINNLTVDEINAALLHLQRSRYEVVGGEKGNTINNINVSNSGGGGLDYQSIITSLKERLTRIEGVNTEQQTQINSILSTLENLSDNGITDFEYDESTGDLTITTADGNEYQTVIRSPSATLTFDTQTKVLTFTFNDEITTITLPFIYSSEKGAANGVATLDATGRVPYSQLPESAMEFKGEWNAYTNTPHLQDGTGDNGDFYVCSEGGTVNFGTVASPRNITFYVNDRVIYEGSSNQWFRLPASEVRTVNNLSGDVVLTGENVNYSNASGSPTLKDKIDSVQQIAETQADWSQTTSSAVDFIKNKPNLATVATSGSYNDLSNKPTIPAAQIQSDWTQTDNTKKDFIKNKIPIWITSGSADDNMSPIDSVTDGNMRPVTSNAVADIMSSLPTDAVLHYSFDDIPDLPDGSADVRLLNNNTYDIQSGNYKFTNNGGTTFSNNNGNLQIAINGGGSNGVFLSYNYVQNKILKIKLKITSIQGTLQVHNGYGNIIKNYTEVGEYELSVICSNTSSYPSFYFIVSASGNSCTFTVEEIYIGTGSYSTPIIDNSGNGNNATNSGLIAQAGVSGKGTISFNKYQVAVNTNFKITPPYSYSVWLKINENFTQTQYFIDGRDGTSLADEGLLAVANKAIYVGMASGEEIQTDGGVVTIGEWQNFVIVVTEEGSGNRFSIYKNGMLIKSATTSTKTTGFRKLTVNGRYEDYAPYNKAPRQLDDFQIFNRALSEQEVQALYLNKANTPKYYDVNNYKLPPPPSTDGNYSLKVNVSSGVATYSWS